MSQPFYVVESVGAGALPRAAGTAYLEAHGQKLPTVIYPEIRVLTADKPTLNCTYYPEAALRGDPEKGTGLSSFTYPYPIPIIRDHVTAPGFFGGMASETYGRVRKPAQFLRSQNEGYAMAMPEITHPEAIEGVLTGRWLTVSLGSRCASVTCSICGAELTETGCAHMKGEQYEDDDGLFRTAYWQIQELKAKEISFVVTPSDDQAGVLNPNPILSESAASRPETLPRILVGDERGVFDLATGARIEESSFLPKPGRRLFGVNVLGSLSSKETTMPDKPKIRPEPEAHARSAWQEEVARVASRNVAESFKGEGRYMLVGGAHDHDAYLDKNGDGTSSWAYQTDPFGVYDHNAAEADYDGDAVGSTGQRPAGGGGPPDPPASANNDPLHHAHEIMGGMVRYSGGKLSHQHYIEPVHAGKERVESSRVGAEKSEKGGDDEANEPLTLGQLYLLPDHHPDYHKPDTAESVEEKTLTARDRNKLSDSAFCGPDRSFPANDKGHVRDGLARLAGSKLSSSQKASVKACLHRKGKAMGMKFSDEAAAFAAKLVDAEHRVEINLYPLPQDAATLTKSLTQVEEVAHTPSQKEAILGRIAAHSRSFLETAEWQQRFGELSSCEEGDPIEIAITPENYALLYSGIAVASRETAAGEPPEETPQEITEETAPEGTTEEPVTQVTETPAETPPHPPAGPRPPGPAPINEAAVKAAVRSAEEKVEKDLSGLDYPKQIERLKEAVAEANERAETETQRASHALAHSCALIMKALRKPAARNQGLEALVKELSVRSTESLNDKLTDLCAEYDEGGPAVANLPRLEDPTETETTGGDPGDPGRAATESDPPPVEPGQPSPTPGARLTPLEELELEEGDPKLFLHSPTLANLFNLTPDPPASSS